VERYEVDNSDRLKTNKEIRVKRNFAEIRFWQTRSVVICPGNGTVVMQPAMRPDATMSTARREEKEILKDAFDIRMDNASMARDSNSSGIEEATGRAEITIVPDAVILGTRWDLYWHLYPRCEMIQAEERRKRLLWHPASWRTKSA
jgi:hypothetical protein